MRWLSKWFQPEPRRFLAVWYTVWLGYDLKGFFVNWLIRHQPIRIAWMPVSGAAETLYLLAEILVVGYLAAQAWRFSKTSWWRVAFIYEWYSLAEIGLSMVNPRIWTYAMNQMWCKPLSLFGETIQPCREPIIWSDAQNVLIGHLGFIALYAFVHHGLPLLVLRRLKQSSRSIPAI